MCYMYIIIGHQKIVKHKFNMSFVHVMNIKISRHACNHQTSFRGRRAFQSEENIHLIGSPCVGNATSFN